MVTPVGLHALREDLGLRVPPPATRSYISAGMRRGETRNGQVVEYYPKQYATDGSPLANLRFALKHEPADLSVLNAALKAIGPEELAGWVRREPTGAYSRRAWFLYETLTGGTLELPPAAAGAYVQALDPKRNVVADGRLSRRHRVVDNLLGVPGFSPTVRRTPLLADYAAGSLDAEARAISRQYDESVLTRAVSYLYTKETRSSFEIEGETPSSSRAERFAAALRVAGQFDPTDKAALVHLQNQIVEARYAESDWRRVQNFVGEVTGGYRDVVHFVAPKPEDVGDLMAGWSRMTARLLASPVDPVVAAAVVAFAFVFIHPFEDGNGRIHRFLIHSVLARRGFGPEGLIFPVSAAILRDRPSYDRALESFSAPLAELIDWRATPEGEIVVSDETADLYRYFDATPLAEFLYARVADTIRLDLKDELDYVAVYDAALAAIRSVADMPDRRSSLLARILLQGGGRLSQAKREAFGELSDAEITAIEGSVGAAIGQRGG